MPALLLLTRKNVRFQSLFKFFGFKIYIKLFRLLAEL